MFVEQFYARASARGLLRDERMNRREIGAEESAAEGNGEDSPLALYTYRLLGLPSSIRMLELVRGRGVILYGSRCVIVSVRYADSVHFAVSYLLMAHTITGLRDHLWWKSVQRHGQPAGFGEANLWNWKFWGFGGLM
jgi:hypothetical protein